MLSFGLGAPAAPQVSGVRLHAPASIAGRDARSPEARGIAADVAQARGLRDLGALDRKVQIPVGLLLKISHKEELEQLTLLQGDRRSPLYHHYLSSAQFNRYFSPSPTAYARVLATLQRHGFRITQTYRDRTFVTAAAPVSNVERNAHSRDDATRRRRSVWQHHLSRDAGRSSRHCGQRLGLALDPNGALPATFCRQERGARIA
jgi:hypothetical protein